MKKKIFIITEGEYDKKVLSQLLRQHKNIEIEAANGFSSALAKAVSVFQKERQPFILVLDTDTNNLTEFNEKKQMVNNYLGISLTNSLAQVVWMEPELESIFVRNQNILKTYYSKTLSQNDWKKAQMAPKQFIEENVEAGRNSLLSLLSNSNIVSTLLEDKSIKEIIDFIEIKRDLSFSLTNEKPLKKFKLLKPYDFLAITKSIIPSLIGKKPNDWSAELMNNNITLQAKLTKSDKGVITLPIYNFETHISPYHVQPIFDSYILLPGNNKITEDTLLELEVSSDNPNYEFEVTFSYDATNGVKAIN